MMTVMLIRRHLRRTAATTATTTTTATSSASYYAQPQYPAHPLKFRMNYSSPTRAMRYYRIWIYTCNAVLFVCVIGFIIVACKVIVADPRRTLIPDFNLTHPSLLYAYFALIMQSGFLQLVGCLGARNLNERLLNVYWCLLLLLLIGDVLLGLFWVHHFEYIVTQVRPVLKNRFRAQYGSDSEFTELWDMVQRNDQCCGVENYKDFYQNYSFVNWDEDLLSPTALLPASCCGGLSVRQVTTLKPPEARRNLIFSTTTTSSTTVPPLPPIFSTAESISVTDFIITDGIRIRCSRDDEVFYTTGCEKRLLTWLRSSLDILFVLGYCVISFLKLCFLGILRYEIREMIQKIKILQSEQHNNAECQDTSLSGAQKFQQIRRYDHNGSVMGVAQPLLERHNMDADSTHSMDRENSLADDAELSATSPLLMPMEKRSSQENIDSFQTTPAHLNLTNHQRHLSLLNADTGNDSDTNSHCALIIPDEARAKRAQRSSNGNNNYELHELQDLDRIKTSRNRNKI
ncbi:uncharacterized protein LOC135841788 isoform X2 [Planococcus citri]|uniref:uncharacterized protein LOC135841788 isoform X2 n=1 Tax=Planococcus citri TaxID=170843 RepID=UPI0031F87454